MKQLSKQLISIGLIILLASSSFSRINAAEIPVYEEAEMVVTATRTEVEPEQAPGMTEVITQTEIEASPATTVAEILTEKGLTVPSYGNAANASSIQMDGFSANQTLVLVNGNPVHTGNTGSVDLSYFPLSGVQQIEVVHGPMSALYGSGGLGGVVNIITDLTGDTATKVVVSGGSFDTYKTGLALQQEKFGIAMGGFTTDGEQENHYADSYYFLGQYDFYQNDSGYLIVDLAHRTKAGRTPGSLTWPSITDENIESNNLTLRGRHQQENLTWEYQLSGQGLDYECQDSYGYSRHETKQFQAELAGIYTVANHNFLGGVSLSQYQSKSTDTGKHTLDNSALILQDEWYLNDNWSLISGVRYDDTEHGKPLSPRFALINRVSPGFTWKIGYSKAFRAPTVNELFWPYYSNPDLKPEYSQRYEITGVWKYAKQNWELNLFHADIEDGVVNDANYIPQNIATMEADGAILVWRTQLNELISFGVRYAYLNKQDCNESAVYQDLNFFGREQISGDVTFGSGNWQFGLHLYRVARRVQNGSTAPNYNLVNLNYTYQFNPSFSGSLAVNNLTDEEYQVYKDYPMLTRQIILTLKHSF